MIEGTRLRSKRNQSQAGYQNREGARVVSKQTETLLLCVKKKSPPCLRAPITFWLLARIAHQVVMLWQTLDFQCHAFS